MHRGKANPRKIKELLRVFCSRLLSRFGHRFSNEVVAGLDFNGDNLAVVGRFQVVLQALLINHFAPSHQPFLIDCQRSAHGFSCSTAPFKGSEIFVKIAVTGAKQASGNVSRRDSTFSRYQHRGRRSSKVGWVEPSETQRWNSIRSFRLRGLFPFHVDYWLLTPVTYTFPHWDSSPVQCKSS